MSQLPELDQIARNTAQTASNVSGLTVLLEVILIAMGALHLYRTYYPPKPQATIQLCAHLKSYLDGSQSYEREYLEKITCGPVGYRDATDAMVADVK